MGERRLFLHPLLDLVAEAATVISEPPFLECMERLETKRGLLDIRIHHSPSVFDIGAFVTRKRGSLYGRD